MAWLGLYNYWVVIFLMMAGFYVVIARGNLVKKIVGLNVFVSRSRFKQSGNACYGSILLKKSVSREDKKSKHLRRR